MSARPYHKRYHSDALAGFMSLDLEERGAFQTVLDLIYDRGGPIADNDRLLAGYMGCSVRKWRTLRESLLTKRKIYLTSDGEISNRRAEKEFENDAKTTRKHAENGSKGARVRIEHAKKPNENRESGQARLKPPSSIPDTIVRIEEDRTVSRTPRASETQPGEPTEFEQRCRTIAGIARLVRPISQQDREVMRGWLRDGLHFEFHIVEGVKVVAAREESRGRAISGFKYLDGGVRDYHADWVRENERLKLVASGGNA